jgi:hypothetical protein
MQAIHWGFPKEGSALVSLRLAMMQNLLWRIYFHDFSKLHILPLEPEPRTSTL